MTSILEAWDPIRQQAAWRIPQKTFYNGGILSTATDLVFQGTAGGEFVAYEARTGARLASIATGTGIMAAPVAYEIDGEEYVAVAAGFGGAVLGSYVPGAAALDRQNLGRILTFKLHGGPVPLAPPLLASEQYPLPAPVGKSQQLIQRGHTLFLANCGGCHSERGGGGYPNLWNLPPAIHEIFEKIVLDGVLSENGMASFANVLEPQDVKAIHAYLIEDARTLRAAEKRPAAAPTKRQR